MRIQILGTTAVRVAGRTINGAELGGVKPRQILELLALDLGVPIAKDRLADLLWDGAPPASAMGTLESYVCVLRRSLGLGSGRTSLLATTPLGYRLNPDGVSVDLADFARLSRNVVDARPASAVTAIEKAIALVQGDLLSDEPYASWALRARDCFVRDLVAAADRGARLATAIGDHAAAERLARTAVAADPLCEEASQSLMTALAAGGRRCEALRVFAELRAKMQDEIGVEPGAVTHGLYLEVLRGAESAYDQSAAAIEVPTLVRLLRQALAAAPGITLDLGLRHLVDGAVGSAA